MNMLTREKMAQVYESIADELEQAKVRVAEVELDEAELAILVGALRIAARHTTECHLGRTEIVNAPFSSGAASLANAGLNAVADALAGDTEPAPAKKKRKRKTKAEYAAARAAKEAAAFAARAEAEGQQRLPGDGGAP